jgi:hypothetical protein
MQVSMPWRRSFQITEKAHFHRLSGDLRPPEFLGNERSVEIRDTLLRAQFSSPLFAVYFGYLQLAAPYLKAVRFTANRLDWSRLGSRKTAAWPRSRSRFIRRRAFDARTNERRASSGPFASSPLLSQALRFYFRCRPASIWSRAVNLLFNLRIHGSRPALRYPVSSEVW